VKDVRDYIEDFHPPLERLEPLLEKVQRDAYFRGLEDGSVQMFEIIKDKIEQSKRNVKAALDQG
jgi:hypothetical protein